MDPSGSWGLVGGIYFNYSIADHGSQNTVGYKKGFEIIFLDIYPQCYLLLYKVCCFLSWWFSLIIVFDLIDVHYLLQRDDGKVHKIGITQKTNNNFTRYIFQTTRGN